MARNTQARCNVTRVGLMYSSPVRTTRYVGCQILQKSNDTASTPRAEADATRRGCRHTLIYSNTHCVLLTTFTGYDGLILLQAVQSTLMNQPG